MYPRTSTDAEAAVPKTLTTEVPAPHNPMTRSQAAGQQMTGALSLSKGPGCLCIYSAFIPLILCSTVSAQTKDEQIEAQKAFQQALTDYQAGRYEDALDGFMTAQALEPEVGNYYNMARCLQKMGRLREAIEYFNIYIDGGGPKKDKATKYIAQIKQTPAHVTVNSLPEGATIWIDSELKPVGQAPLTIDMSPGKHKLTAELPGYGFGYRIAFVSFGDSYSYTVKVKKSKHATEKSAPLPAVPAAAPGPLATPPAEPEVLETPSYEAKPADVEVDARVRPVSNTLLAGAGMAIPVSFPEVMSFVSIDLSWELRIGDYVGTGLGLDIHVAGNGQLYSPYALLAINIPLPRGFSLFGRLGLGAVVAKAPDGAEGMTDGMPADFLVRLGIGLNWSRKGFNLRLDAVHFNVLAGAGDVSSGPAAQFVPRLLLGYTF